MSQHPSLANPHNAVSVGISATSCRNPDICPSWASVGISATSCRNPDICPSWASVGISTTFCLATVFGSHGSLGHFAKDSPRRGHRAPFRLLQVLVLVLGMVFSGLALAAEPEPDVTLVASSASVFSGATVWYATLSDKQPLPPPVENLPGLDQKPVFWSPERTADGEKLGWKMVLGSPEQNLLADAAITHGSQPFEFFGWHFLPVASEPLGLTRRFALPQGNLEVKILDFAIEKTDLHRLSVRCSWTPSLRRTSLKKIDEKRARKPAPLS